MNATALEGHRDRELLIGTCVFERTNDEAGASPERDVARVGPVRPATGKGLARRVGQGRQRGDLLEPPVLRQSIEPKHVRYAANARGVRLVRV